MTDSNFLLQENSFRIDQEDGFGILIEFPSPTPTVTTTQTPTNTPTLTNTQTPSSTSVISYLYSNSGVGVVDIDACNDSGNNLYGIRLSFSSLQIGDIIYTNSNLTSPLIGSSYVSNGGIYYTIDSFTSQITSPQSLCGL
jgi:hypothetical protein